LDKEIILPALEHTYKTVYECLHFKTIEYNFIMNLHMSKCKVTAIFVRFKNCWIFWSDLHKLLHKIFLISHSVEYLVHSDTKTDGRTDRHNDVNIPFPKFFVRF